MIKHAFLPAIISYVALVYIVHLEACKANLLGLPRRTQRTLTQSLLSFLMTVIGLIILSGIVYTLPSRRFRSAWFGVVTHGMDGLFLIFIILSLVLGLA